MSVGSFSSITATGRPFRNTVRSGRMILPDAPATVSWRSTSRSFAAGLSKSTSRARSPRVSPLLDSRYSISTPSVTSAWNQRLFWISVGCGGRDKIRTTSSMVSCGRSGLRRRITLLSTVVRITLPGPN